MIMITTPIRLYGRKVTTDLVLRSGSASANDYSCHHGMNGIVSHFYKGDTSANLEYLFETQKDFDSDIVQPHCTDEDYNKIQEREEYAQETPYNPAKDKVEFTSYFRRLEDICDGYLEDYISNLCVTIFRMTGSNGALTYDKTHYLQPTLVSLDDDSVTELADLQLRVDSNDWSNASKAQAIEDLPYVMKRLDNLSRYCGIHMISMIGSYLKAKEYNQHRIDAGVSKSSLKKNAVIAEGVYKYDSDGVVGGLIEVTNKSKRAADMFDWIVGNNDNYPSYRDDLTNFIQYCRILNVDLYNEDLRKYDGAYMSKLTVLTLTPDTQYCQAVFDAIRDSGLSKPATDINAILLSTTNCFRDMCETNEVLLSVIAQHDSIKAQGNMNKAKQLHYIWSLKHKNPPELPSGNYTWQDGFLYYNDEIVMLDTVILSKQSLAIPKCVISELGYIIHINDTMYIEAMTIDCAYDNMQHMYIASDPDYDIQEWVWFQ